MGAILSKLGRALVTSGSGVYNVYEGTVNVGTGAAAMVTGTVVDPLLRASGSFGTGVIQEAQDLSGVKLVSQERLEAMKRAGEHQGFKDNALVQMGRDTATVGALDFAQTAKDIERAGLILAGDEEGAEEALEDKRNIGEVQDDKRNIVSALAGLATVKTPVRAAVSVAPYLLPQADAADDEPEELTPEERAARWDKRMEERRQQQIDAAMADAKNILADVEDAEQLESLSAEQSLSYAQILNGPDGWQSVGDYDKGLQAWRAHQAGDYDFVRNSWNAWRAAGGRWRMEG